MLGGARRLVEQAAGIAAQVEHDGARAARELAHAIATPWANERIWMTRTALRALPTSQDTSRVLPTSTRVMRTSTGSLSGPAGCAA